MNEIKTGVVFGGPSPEHDISILTGLQVCRTLEDVTALYWTKAGSWQEVQPDLEAGAFADGVPPQSRDLRFVAEPGGGFWRKKRHLELGVVVNCCHGGPGEDGTLQALFDLAGLSYTGPGVAASALGMDKLAFAGVVAEAGLPTLPRTLLDHAAPLFPGPYIVKPRFGGSSIGIEVVEDHATALALVSSSPPLEDGAVLEPFLERGRDLNIAVRTHPQLEFSAIEAPIRSGSAIYDYSAKYLAEGGLEGSQRELPAQIPDEMGKRIRELARRIVELVGLRSLSRIDFLVDGEDLYINEVNTIPGSLAAYLWVDPPVTRRQLLEDMIDEALAAGPASYTTVGADGTALRSAGTIASKLG